MYDAMMAETIKVDGHNGDEIEAYLARPLAPGPSGGVVVIHHMPGYDAATKEMVRRFAAHGYAAICPNLYWREAPGASPDDASATVRAGGGVRGGQAVAGRCYVRRSTISFLISAIAFAGFRCFGQVWVQFRMVWQRYSLNGSSRSSRRAPVSSSRLSMIHR